MKYNQPFGVSDPNASYVNGNPATGMQGSIPQMEAIEYDQREIVSIINTANLRAYRDFDGAACTVGVNTDLTQLRKAVEAYARWWTEFWYTNRGIGEAPIDGRIYGRVNSVWGVCPLDAPADNNYYMRYNNTWVIPPPGPPFPEAPTDGQIYGRLNAAWTVIPPGGGGGIPEAPYDNNLYERRNGQWSVQRPYDTIYWNGDANYLGGGDYTFQISNPLSVGPIMPSTTSASPPLRDAKSDSPTPLGGPALPIYPYSGYFSGLSLIFQTAKWDLPATGPCRVNVTPTQNVYFGWQNIYRNDGQLLKPGDLQPLAIIVWGRLTNIGVVEGFFVMGLVRSQIIEITGRSAPIPPISPKS